METAGIYRINFNRDIHRYDLKKKKRTEKQKNDIEFNKYVRAFFQIKKGEEEEEDFLKMDLKNVQKLSITKFVELALYNA